MRKTYRLLPVFVLLLCASIQTFAQRPSAAFTRADGAPDTSEYRSLVEKAKSGDSTVDFVAFRAAYLNWVNDECNQTEAPQREEMVKAFDAKDYATAVRLGEVVLDYEFVNRGLHGAMANAYKELNMPEKEKLHTDIAKKLMAAILASGDGLSAKTAYRVHSIREEYVVMQQLGYQVSMQALVFDKTYGSFDVLSGKNKDGKEGSFYFDINGFWIGSTASKPCKNKIKK